MQSASSRRTQFCHSCTYSSVDCSESVSLPVVGLSSYAVTELYVQARSVPVRMEHCAATIGAVVLSVSFCRVIRYAQVFHSNSGPSIVPLE